MENLEEREGRDSQTEELIGAVYDCFTLESVLAIGEEIFWEEARQISHASPDQIVRLEIALRSQAERYGGMISHEVSRVLLEAKRASAERKETAKRKTRKKKRVGELSRLFSGLFHGAETSE